MHKLHTLILTSLLALSSFALQAQEYHYNEAQAMIGDLDGADGFGFAIGFSRELNQKSFYQIGYRYAEASDFDYWQDTLLVSYGQHGPLNEKFDWFATAGMLIQWVETNNFDDSDSGPRLTGGVVTDLDDKMELRGEIGYVSIWDDSDIGLIVRLEVEDKFGVEFETIGDLQLIKAFIRF